MGPAVTDDERKRRNYVIAGAGGGFLLPLAGIVGALIFYSRGDNEAARILILGSVAGVIAYVLVFAAF
jgi:zinc transporter ZupT